MPTTTITVAHRLAALLAVEREAEYQLRVAVGDSSARYVLYGRDSDEYRRAEIETEAAYRAQIAAHIATDDALHEVAS